MGKMGETFFFKCNLLETHLDRSSVLRVEIGNWKGLEGETCSQKTSLREISMYCCVVLIGFGHSQYDYNIGGYGDGSI